MDVILTPGTAGDGTWGLADRLGRDLGSVWKVDGFEIRANPTGQLRGVPLHHATLDSVMDAIGRHMDGACSLDGRGWD